MLKLRTRNCGRGGPRTRNCGRRRAAASDYRESVTAAAGDGGLLLVTLAGASEPGWPLCVTTDSGWQLCVTSDSGHSKFHVLREQGLSDSESGHRVTAWAGLVLVSLAVREEREKYIQPPKF